MSEIGLFEVIGPCMVGPSSSHTAGACKIAQTSYKLFRGKIKRVTFTLYGSFAQTYLGHGSDRALLGGILGFEVYDMRLKDSKDYAKEAGLEYEFIIDTDTKVEHANTIGIHMENEDGTHRLDITGVSLGGGKMMITCINGVSVAFTGEFPTLVIYHRNVPGVISFITGILGDYQINIANMRCYRESRRENAISIIESDQEISNDVIKDIEDNSLIKKTILIQES